MHPDTRLNGGRPAGSRVPSEFNGARPIAGASANGAAPLAGTHTKAEPARKAAPAPKAAKAAPAPVMKAGQAPPAVKAAPVQKKAAAPSRRPAAATGPVSGRQLDVWDERIAGALSFLRRRLTGQYEVDEFGFDPELTETVVYPVLRMIYRRYFRVEASGVEYLPRHGSALLVANHSGTIPVDAMMLSVAVHDETPDHRHLRLLGADLVFRIPVLSELARKGGSTLACNSDAERLLRNAQYVGVFPEGFKGVGKRYRDRYKLQRFGRGGFVSAALRTGAPIVPVSIIGAEEIYPIIGNIKPLAKVTGLPYVPVTPLFPWLGPIGMIPLPSKWLIEFGEPIETASYEGDADDPIVVFNLADQVRETIQQTLHKLLERRPDPFA